MATKILWSGLTGRTGREAIKQLTNVTDVEIVAGISRYDYDGKGLKIDAMKSSADGLDSDKSYDFSKIEKWYLYGNIANPLKEQPNGFDALVDFSDQSVFEKVVELAVRTHVPLISGTSDLSNRQMALLYDATNQIPIFRGGNFRFEVKRFADEAVEFAKTHDDLILIEQHWTGQPLPSEAAKMIGYRILQETDKLIQIVNGAPYTNKSLVNEWILCGDDSFEAKISCKVVGFDELAHDVLEIAKVIARMPVKKGEFYDLDEIWDELSH